MRKSIICFIYTSILSIFVSCNKEKDLYSGYWVDDLNKIENSYIYPFSSEDTNIVAEIEIETDGTINPEEINVVIPPLKYNKSWLCMLTQDDCKHAAFSTTWAAINGKPLSTKYYYDFIHLLAGDLPPDIYHLNKTLGSTDGTGNEVRFAFTTTLAPEEKWMNAYTSVALQSSKDDFRFYMKSGLTWINVIEMLNYDTGIAFHDIITESENNVDSIVKHYNVAQNIILEKLRGRGCKVLAEPNGNKNYIRAAQKYDPIQIMTAQNDKDGIVVNKLYPFKVESNLHKGLYMRSFIEPAQVRSEVQEQLNLPKEERKDIHIGVHGTDYAWINLLLWINDNYGKDGDDSVWFPSYEEYYEYNYNRINSTITKSIDGNKIKIVVQFPQAQYFYFPSTTINIEGLHKENVISVSSNNAITGLSHADYENGYMVNIDCRKSLVSHATHYVEMYEKNKSDESLKNDATYFVNRLKNSDSKTSLLNRIK